MKYIADELSVTFSLAQRTYKIADSPLIILLLKYCMSAGYELVWDDVSSFN